MKILEIYNSQVKTVLSNKKDFSVSSGNRPEGIGAYGKVVTDKDPHLINKISIDNDECYNAFIEFLLLRKLPQRNPHFPRIYEIKTYKTQNTHKNKWKIERLNQTLDEYLRAPNIKLTDFIEKVELLSDHYLNDFSKNKINDMIEILHEKIKQNALTSYHVKEIYKTLSKNLKTPDDLKNGLYKEALEIVYYYKNSELPGCMIDLHQNNIMLRFGKYIPQLVIIDPYAPKNYE